MVIRLLSRPGRTGRTVAAATVLLMTAALGAGLGAVTTAAQAGAPPAPVTWTVLVGSQTDDMAIQGQRFLPGDITIDAGDTVTWQANGMEIHTVTFLDGGTPQASLPPLDPTDPQQVTRQGGDTMDGTSYFNSGVLTTGPDAGPLPVPAYASYSLTFPGQGTFTYYCLVHGVMMRGVVHVQPAGAPTPPPRPTSTPRPSGRPTPSTTTAMRCGTRSGRPAAGTASSWAPTTASRC